MKKERLVPMAALAAVASLGLSACGGSVGDSEEASDEGFEYGASQEEVDTALEGLDPVTLTYQPAAASQNSLLAPAAQAFKENVEDRSGGQVTVELVYGQAIAGYEEIDDALADGRLDLAFNVLVYNPSDYPTYDALSTALHGLPVSPATGEAIYSAVAADIGWSTEDLLDEYESQGVTPLSPMMNGGGYYPLCTDPASEHSDWQGRQVRVASSAHLGVVEDMGASPVSMEYVEMYEALQRGTVDCTFGELSPSAERGVLEVAPHIMYTDDDNSLSSRTSPALLAGSSFDEMPLAYQQILFDATATHLADWVGVTADGNAEAVQQSKDAGGTIEPVNDETQRRIGDTQEAQVEGLIEEGRLNEGVPDQIQESEEKWTAVADELGLEDPGNLEDMNEWWEDDAMDFVPFSERVFEEVALPHRPE